MDRTHCPPDFVFPSALYCPRLWLTLRLGCCVPIDETWALLPFDFNAMSIFPVPSLVVFGIWPAFHGQSPGALPDAQRNRTAAAVEMDMLCS